MSTVVDYNFLVNGVHDSSFSTVFEIINGIQIIFSLVLFIVFITLIRNCAFFIKDVYHSLTYAVTTRFSYESVFWSWFIPILWFFKPFQVIKEIEHYKLKKIEFQGARYNLNFWWFGFLFFFWITYVKAIIFYAFFFSMSDNPLWINDTPIYGLYRIISIVEYCIDLLRIGVGFMAYRIFLKMIRTYLDFQETLVESGIENEISDHLID